MNLIFLGPPGVGKGTHAELIAEHHGIIKISTGDLVREEIKNKTGLGQKIKKYYNSGELVPDNFIIEMLENRIKRPDCKKGFILDGFPRTPEQVEALEKIMDIDLVVNFNASHKTLIERISNRLTCRKCGEIYNIKFVKPKKEGMCDKCGGELYWREDQKPEVVENRLKVYEEETKPLIDYYREKGLLIDFNAEGPKEEVHQRLKKTLEKYFEK